MGVIKMGNIMPRVGIDPSSLAFQASVLSITSPRLPGVTTLPTPTFLCGSVPERLGQTTTFLIFIFTSEMLRVRATFLIFIFTSEMLKVLNFGVHPRMLDVIAGYINSGSHGFKFHQCLASITKKVLSPHYGTLIAKKFVNIRWFKKYVR